MSSTPAPAPSQASGLGGPSGGDSRPLSASVRRGAAWNALSTLTLRLSNVAITAVVAHILAPRDFGVFTVALTAYTIVFNLAELGVGSCILRADLDIDSVAPTMVTVALVTSAISAEAMAIFAKPIATELGSADGAQAIRVMALAMLIGGVSAVPSAQLTRDFQQGKLFVANAVSLVPSTAVLFLLARSGGGAMAFAWSRVVTSFVMCGMMMAFVPKRYLPSVNRGALSLLFRFGLPLAAANFINFILINVDYAFVGHLIGPIALGAYVLAFTLASAPGLLVGGVINGMAVPAFSRVKHDPALLKGALASALRAVSLIIMPMAALMMALARPLVLTLYGTKWAASVEVLSILSFYGAISIICILFASILTSLGKAKFTLAVQLLWIGALVPAMAIGVHRNGIVGAAVAHIVVIAPLVLPSYLVALRRATGIGFPALGKAVLLPLLGASAAAVAARTTASLLASPLAQLAAGLAVGGVIYVVAVAPQAVTLLGQQRTARLRALPVFRWYEAAARVARLPVNAGSGPGDRSGRHRAGKAGSAQRPAPSNVALIPPPAGQATGGAAVRAAVRVTELLRPGARVVPFWPRAELDEMAGWCRTPAHVAVRLVTGEGGSGKTRLAVELARIAAGEGWQPRWVPPGAEREALSAARRMARPTVLLVDDAETRTGLAGFLGDTVDGLGGPDLRVVLLARNSGDWWQEHAGAGHRLGRVLTAAPPVRLRPVSGGAALTEVFDAALTGFAARLGVARPAVRLSLTEPDASILVVHAAALCAVAGHPDERPRSSAAVLEDLLGHELRYCAQAAAARGLGLDPGGQRRAVAAACLIGADSEPAAVGLLRRLPGFASSAALPVARWLRDLYPGLDVPGRMATEWLGPMYPDRLAEHLVVGEFAATPGVIPALFAGLDEPRAARALTVLARAAPGYPDAVPMLARALAADFERLVFPALRVAVETNPVLDRLIAEALASRAVRAEVLERIAAATPRRSRALARTAAAVHRRPAGESSDGSTERQLAQ